jgi:CelD/BcsL family acetyltransferase involved in cellulose biosynthesis
MNGALAYLKQHDQLIFETYQGLEGLESLAPAWSALVESMPGARFAHYPEWYRAYLCSLESDPSRVWFIGAYQHQKLIGVFPLQFQKYVVKGMQPRVFGTIDDDEMQSCDFVFRRTAENAGLLYEFTQWLRKQRKIRWDELRLRKVREDSAIAHSARARLPSATIMLCHDGSGYFQTGGTYDLATESMSGTFKRNLRRLARRAEETAPLRLQSYRRSDELHDAFEIFLQIEASGWKGDAGSSSAIRCRPAMLAFYRAVVNEFGPRDACVINVLWHGGRPVAGQFCLHIGATLNILKIGFSDEHASFAPGNLLLERTIRMACEERNIDIVSLVNNPSWARNFKPLSLGVWSYCAPNWTVRGALIHVGVLAKRALDARTRKPLEIAKPEADVEVAL